MMVKPLSDDAQVILALIKKYRKIEGKHIGRELGIDMKRVIKGTWELKASNLIGIDFVCIRENVYSDDYEIANFYPKY